MKTDRRKYVGITEAAELIGVDPKTVRKMIKLGQLRTAMIGEQRKVTVRSIDALDPDHA